MTATPTPTLREAFTAAGFECAPYDDAALERVRDRILDEFSDGAEPWQILHIFVDEFTREEREAELARRRAEGG